VGTSRKRASFYTDLGRLWSNCRRYLGYDECGRPTRVLGRRGRAPAIIWCAFLLEKMARKFALDHLPGNEVPDSWREASLEPNSRSSDRWSLPANRSAAEELR